MTSSLLRGRSGYLIRRTEKTERNLSKTRNASSDSRMILPVLSKRYRPWRTRKR